MKLQNLHTHTSRCNHAQGTEADYASAALTAGLEHLGFSDHMPFPDGRWARDRMPLEQLSKYCEAVADAARRTKASGLCIYLGLECEYDPAVAGFLKDLVSGPHSIGYLVCGIHYFMTPAGWKTSFASMDSPGQLGLYTDTLIRAMSSGLFSFVAHPDLFGMSCGKFGPEEAECSRAICEAAASLGLPLEINTSGYRRDVVKWPEGPGRPYPIPAFWEIASASGTKCVVNADAHRPEDVAANLKEGYSFAASYGLTPMTPSELRLRAL